ncbi:hypothetical protein AAKU55_000778 [Oxalobacteraceae bacterium GrIS 1.11]
MRRFLIFFALTSALVLLPAACLSVYFQPLDGDLTRIGAYAERDFGWNAPHPVINIHKNGKSMTDPDILVLGDSFSEHNIWQSILSDQLHKKILSFRIDQVGCINGWLEYALNQSTAKTVVLETVERNFLDRMLNLDCKDGNFHPFELAATTSALTRPNWPPELRVNQTFQVAINTLKMTANPNLTLNGNVVNATIKPACAKFSNRHADRILYYPVDRDKLRWPPEEQARAISNVMRLQQRFTGQGKKLVFIVVPDKLSVYQDCLLADPDRTARKRVNIIQTLIASGANTPDLLHQFQQQIGVTVDLYNPNNTHLSESGYLSMARQIAPLFDGRPTAIPAAE